MHISKDEDVKDEWLSSVGDPTRYQNKILDAIQCWILHRDMGWDEGGVEEVLFTVIDRLQSAEWKKMKPGQWIWTNRTSVVDAKLINELYDIVLMERAPTTKDLRPVWFDVFDDAKGVLEMIQEDWWIVGLNFLAYDMCCNENRILARDAIWNLIMSYRSELLYIDLAVEQLMLLCPLVRETTLAEFINNHVRNPRFTQLFQKIVQENEDLSRVILLEQRILDTHIKSEDVDQNQKRYTWLQDDTFFVEHSILDEFLLFASELMIQPTNQLSRFITYTTAEEIDEQLEGSLRNNDEGGNLENLETLQQWIQQIKQVIVTDEHILDHI